MKGNWKGAYEEYTTARALKEAIVAPALFAVARAIREGKLPRLDGTIRCVDCGQMATQYDHREYARPLDVVPVCRSCNIRRGPASDVKHLCYRYSPGLAPRRPPARFQTADNMRYYAKIAGLFNECHAELGGMPTDTQPLESDNAPQR